MAAGPSYSDALAKRPLADSFALSSAPAAATMSITPDANSTAYLTSFTVTGTGASGASVIAVTITGSNAAHTPTFYIAIPGTTTTEIVRLVVTLSTPLAGAAPGTAIVVNVPSFGSGNTNMAGAAVGFQQ